MESMHGKKREIFINCFSYWRDKMPGRVSQLKEREVISTHRSRVHHSRKIMEAGAGSSWSHRVHSQEAER